MAYHGITSIEQIPVEEDIRREKEFNQATTQYAELLQKLSYAHIPLIIHPGKRVKSKKEMRQIEENLTESRKPQKVTAFKRPSRQERRKKSQVEEKIKNAMASAEGTDGKPKHKKKERAALKKAKKQRLGKSRRQKMSHTQ
ncbi:hypothetical protein NEIRO03_1997 [Nematocida sp. AWRm78]|nr:hypothetical protein NEIRO02_2503 [Nematocida sp. AWRm79]KAI5185332.1 hypothetical protein NEIRO03_1997 [Nematocida sp. AWRm78]